MSTNPSKQRFTPVLILVGCLLAVAGIAVATKSHWLPLLQRVAKNDQGAKKSSSSDSHAGHDHGGHSDAHEGHEGHDHGGHDESSSLHLSEQALRNIGLTKDKLQPIKLGTFTRTLNVPARVVERPGRTKVQVTAPMTGVVTAVFALQGEAVLPGTLLFKVRLTHEDLVQAQTAFLKTLGELDVEEREIARLASLGASGVIAGKTLLERKYSKQKLLAALNANREALSLHGLSPEQIDAITRDRRLLRELEVRVPSLPKRESSARSAAHQAQLASVSQGAKGQAVPKHLFMVQVVNVNTGSMVRAGDPLAILADLSKLYVEGKAFEQDADEITYAARMESAGEFGWDVTAVLENNKKQADTVSGLKIAYIDNEVESDSRALRFFVDLPNEVVQDTMTPHGHRFLTWRFKPGQRMQLRVPVEKWEKRIVLPVDAVAQEGAETFVFLQNGDHFDRRPVHTEYRDQLWVVIANDGSLFPGDTVALTGAHQMQVALKNKAGGGVDPHAGHNH